MQRNTAELSARVQYYLGKRQIRPWEDSTQVYAYVNHGRWVADCPCGGAELVTEDQPLLCGSCGGIRPVVWPEDVEGIERALADRVRQDTQNWRPGESVEMLEVEGRSR
jgi:hypothetical protein